MVRDNRGVDLDVGWVNRELTSMRREIEALRSERRSSSTTVTNGGTFTVDLSGRLILHLPTTSAPANVTVDAVTGDLARSTSSARYKQEIDDVDLDVSAILKMRPRGWRDRGDVKARGDKARHYVGFVAEELDEAGLGMFVGYNAKGLPESVDYDRLTVALFILTRALQCRGNALVARIAKLEATVAALTDVAEAPVTPDLSAEVAEDVLAADPDIIPTPI